MWRTRPFVSHVVALYHHCPQRKMKWRAASVMSTQPITTQLYLYQKKNPVVTLHLTNAHLRANLQAIMFASSLHDITWDMEMLPASQNSGIFIRCQVTIQKRCPDPQKSPWTLFTRDSTHVQQMHVCQLPWQFLRVIPLQVLCRVSHAVGW